MVGYGRVFQAGATEKTEGEPRLGIVDDRARNTPLTLAVSKRIKEWRSSRRTR
jgi:hypothetical protein